MREQLGMGRAGMLWGPSALPSCSLPQGKQMEVPGCGCISRASRRNWPSSELLRAVPFISLAVGMLWSPWPWAQAVHLRHTPCWRKMQPHGSVMPPWNCASPQASSLRCAHPGPSGWVGMWVPAVPARPLIARWPWGGDRINLCSRHSSADSFGISQRGDKPGAALGSRGPCHTRQVHLALRELFPLPSSLPSCCFSLCPKANRPVPAQLG